MSDRTLPDYLAEVFPHRVPDGAKIPAGTPHVTIGSNGAIGVYERGLDYDDHQGRMWSTFTREPIPEPEPARPLPVETGALILATPEGDESPRLWTKVNSGRWASVGTFGYVEVDAGQFASWSHVAAVPVDLLDETDKRVR